MSILQTGWDKLITHDGRPYYVNHNDGTTQWDPPDAAGSSHPVAHPVVMTAASTALVPTYPRRHTPDGGVQNLGSAFLYLVQTFAATLLQMATPAPGEEPAWHYEFPRRVR